MGKEINYEPPAFDYTHKQIEKLIDDIWWMEIDERNLPVDLYESFAKYLITGIAEGFGGAESEFEGSRLELFNELKENIGIFSGARTYAQVAETTEAMYAEKRTLDGFNKFKQRAADIYARYNGGDYLQESVKRGWLQTEYETTVASAQNADNWRDMMDTKDIFPYCTFSAVMDKNTTDECRTLNGHTFRLDDPTLNTCTPPLAWNCRSTLDKTDDDKDLVTPAQSRDLREHAEKHMPDNFKMNSGKDKYIFSPETGYFKVIPKEDIAFARRNFDLPLPE